MTAEQSVFVVDDEAGMRESVAGMAASMGVNAETYQSAEDFLARCDHTRTGCLVLDIWLRGMSGVELLDVMRRYGICLPAIVVTAKADVSLAVRVMHSGAFTLLEKPYRVQELWNTIRQALALDAQTRHNGARAVDVRSQLASLTPDEERILQLILAGRTNKGISQALSLRLRTVEARRHSLMAKLKADSLAELVQVVTEVRLLGSVPFARTRVDFSAAASPPGLDDRSFREAQPAT
jgi:FixJ family two-component response regulator